MQQWWRGGRVIREHYNLLVVGDESSMKMTVGMEGMGRHVWTRRRMARHCIEHDGTTHDCEATSDAAGRHYERNAHDVQHHSIAGRFRLRSVYPAM
jgi:hypothetical protein